MSVFVYIIILLLPVATRALTPGVISSYISAPRKVLPGPIPPNSFKITRNVTQEQCAADCSLQYHLNQFHCYAFEYMASAKMCMLTNMTTLVLKGGYLGLIDNPNMNYFERSKGQYINLFQPYPNQVLEDQKTYFAVFHNMTLEKCALFCLIETRDTCMSFSYNPSKQVCGLSKVFYVENNGQKLVTSPSYNHYQYFSSWPCNATIPWNYSPRAIASPYFPYASVKDVNCHLVIEAPQGKQIDLVFSTFFSQSNLCENQRGGISVHDGSSESSSLLSQLCTSDHFVDRRFRSSKGYLYIEFATGSIPLAFKAVYDFIEVDPCSFSPCQNMGSCSSNAGQYMCRCVPGFTGRDCETNVNECANNPCLLGGTCVDLVNGFKCTCPNMLGGTRCDKYIGLCYLEPCQNGGECTPRGADRYLCQCPKGWGGTNCTEVVVDPCLSQPCFNGARCSASVDQRTYTCICAPGFSGGQCQTNINECENNPCFHNIPCTDLINDYRCECPSFMAGKNCERFVGRCSENPCVHGKCVPTGRDNYTCECEPSFTGSNCESLFINYCDPSPCKHGACRSFSNGPSCECDFGYDGFLCDQKKNYCEGVNCTQGECKNGDGDFRCECIVGFQGRYCNETINHCLEADCNGGYCINTVTSHFCVCSNGKTGLDCESHKPKCDATVCQNGTCVDKDGVSTCVCNQDFTGNECNTPIDYCINQPCKHGSCTSQPGGFQCSCDDNYTGATCSSEIDHCKINRCIYGFCQNLEDRFQCICAAGYHGDLCQYKPGETTTTTTTTTTTPSTTSSATTTKEATTTSTALSTQSSGCTQETCVHGICETDFMNLCICLPGFRGDKCDQFDGCSRHNPCRHGNCTDTLIGFTCSCEKGYSGLMCESRLLETDPCNQHPCSVGACVPSGNTFRCEMDVLTGASNFTSSNSQNLGVGI